MTERITEEQKSAIQFEVWVSQFPKLTAEEIKQVQEIMKKQVKISAGFDLVLPPELVLRELEFCLAFLHKLGGRAAVRKLPWGPTINQFFYTATQLFDKEVAYYFDYFSEKFGTKGSRQRYTDHLSSLIAALMQHFSQLVIQK